jgi:nascent polypeptide-associated complex subunit beta
VSKDAEIAALRRALRVSPSCAGEKLKAKFASAQGAARIGGKGTVRRKITAVHKVTAVDDKKLGAALKKLKVQSLPGVEEVNIFKEDNSIIHFSNPKVSADITSNCYVLTGLGENKSVQELLPGILTQMGPSGLKALTDSLVKGKGGVPKGMEGLAAAAQAAAGGGADEAAAGAKGDDEDMPDMDDNATF